MNELLPVKRTVRKYRVFRLAANVLPAAFYAAREECDGFAPPDWHIVWDRCKENERALFYGNLCTAYDNRFYVVYWNWFWKHCFKSDIC